MFLYLRKGIPILISDTKFDCEDSQCVEVDSAHPVLKDPSAWQIKDGFLEKIVEASPAQLKIAMIADYGINCGIATYTKYLCDAMRANVAELRIFAERAPKEFCLSDEQDNVIRCWDRSGDYFDILPHLEHYNPDIIFIQHEFGLFHQMGLWNTFLSQLSRWRVIVVLHTVLEHRVDHQETALDYRTRALSEAACPEVIVHMKRARETLRDRGYSGRVHYVPHGCLPPSKLSKLPSTKYGMYPNHSIFQYGFGGKHKGWEFAIDVVNELVQYYPNLIYVGIFNMSTFGRPAQIEYHQSLLDYAREKGLERNIAIHRGYQNEEMLANFIRSSRVALFPYQRPSPHWASWGASGAIQLPISLGIPIVLSDFPVFQEYEGKLSLCKTVDEAVEIIDHIFGDPIYEQELRLKSLAVAEERSWGKIAKWYLDCKSNQDSDAL